MARDWEKAQRAKAKRSASRDLGQEYLDPHAEYVFCPAENEKRRCGSARFF